jgi:hypothetical protein
MRYEEAHTQRGQLLSSLQKNLIQLRVDRLAIQYSCEWWWWRLCFAAAAVGLLVVVGLLLSVVLLVVVVSGSCCCTSTP